MTAAELYLILRAGECSRMERQSDAYCRDRLLAINIAALTLTAVNAPERFPETPDEAFPNRAHDWREAKAEMIRISEKFKEGGTRPRKKVIFTDDDGTA